MRHPRPRHTGLLLGLLLIGGCASTTAPPETSYFRLPPVAVSARAQPLVEAPVMIDTFIADGLHSDQALLYSLDPDGERLRAYHYQLWVDPPTRMLQRRLITTLRDAGVAPLVAARLPPSTEPWRISGRIEAFERIRRPDGWHIQVALQLRVDHGPGALPMLVRDYREQRAAGGDTVRDSVRAFGSAVDAIYAAFIADLQRAVSEGAAG